jgi:hypothetical protein
MTRLDERRVANVPYHFARRYLEDVLAPQAASGEKRTIALTVPVRDRALAKDVEIAFSAAVDPKGFDEPWAVHWEPSGGPFPTFDGTLAIRADETHETSVVELEGEYRPPLGALGAAFDAAIGKHIAEATAQELLRRITVGLEARQKEMEKRR